MEVITEGRVSKWDIDSVKEYISKFDTLKDFYNDPYANEVSTWISNRRGRTGDESLTMQNLLSELREKDEKKLTENFKIEFPQYDFENVSYYTDEKHNKIIKGVSCKKKDKEGVVHGELKDIRVQQLTNYTCEKCRSEWKDERYPQDIKSKVQNFLNRIPEDSPLIFNKTADGKISMEDWYLVPRSDGSHQTRLFVKNIKCKNHENPINLYPNGVVADYKGYLEFACRDKKERRGESTMRRLLELSGYTIEKEKKIAEYSSKGRGNRNRLKADAYFVKEDGTVVIAEFDGQQHFEPKPNYGGEEGFEATVLNDLAKNKYCKENGIKLIRISFNDERNISSELETALSMNPMKDIYLSSKYPQMGWNDPKRTMPIQVTESKSKKEYIITESQLKTIVESKSAFIEKLRRRFNEKTMRDYIYHVETEFPNPCEKFDNEFEYADAVINKAVDDFLFQDELWEYFHSGDWPVVKITDMMVTMCKEWFEDGLLGFHQTTCQDEFDDEDFDMMNEDYEIASDKVIVRLFKLFNEYKKTAKTKKELLNIIMEYLPMFGISKTYAIYMLELYLLNYREDGDYSGLNKDNFIDPRNKSGKKTANYQSGDFTKAQLPFQGSNLQGYWAKDRNGVKYYVVKSYGWYPVYIYKEGKWYENFDRYSNSTSKQMLRSRPYTYNNEIDTNVYLMSKKEMEMLESGFSHEDVMKKKKESFRDVSPSSRLSTAETQGWTGDIPYLKIKFKISSIEDLGDKNAVNVDIYDVFKTENYKQIPTPENYLKGEIPNVTPEKIEKEVERKLRQNFSQYLGPKLGNQDEELVTFRFNHLKK
jgi:hypothetical protein